MPIEFHRHGPWDLPEGWVWARLGDLGRWTGGGTPSKSNAAFWSNGTIPWISPKDMKQDFVGDSPDRITEDALANSTTKLVRQNSILMVVRSGILNHTFPVAIADREVTINQDMRALAPPEGIDARYLMFVLRRFQRNILEECTKDGTTVASVEPAQLENVFIPLAPEAEQRRIVARIDELFTEVTDGETALARAREDLDTWRRALLKAAVTGELTREWRDMHHSRESSSEFIQRLSDALDGKSHSRNRRRFADDGDSTHLPEGWSLAEIDNIFHVATGATPKRGEARYYVGGSIPWVTSAVVNASIVLEADQFITDAAIDETNAKVFPRGTILVAMYGEGKTRGKATELGIEAATNQACAALLQPENDFDLREYVKYWFEHNYLELRKQAAGGVQPNLNLEIIKRLRIPIPPRDELVEIVCRLGDKFGDAVATSREFDEMEKDAVELKQSLLNAAFKGCLVEQDPRDESADLLLARLNEKSDAEAPACRPRGRHAAIAAE